MYVAQPIEWTDQGVVMLDQRRLPAAEVQPLRAPPGAVSIQQRFKSLPILRLRLTLSPNLPCRFKRSMQHHLV